MTYFGFALADSMFSGTCVIERRAIDVETVRQLADEGKLTPCVNFSHAPTIEAMRYRYGISVEVPETPPRVQLASGDAVIVMGVRGLPRLTDRHEYTKEEIASASFSFSMYSVV